MKKLLVFLVTLQLISVSMVWGASITISKHNLSISGPGPYKVDTGGTGQICIFCHTPHNAMINLPLWNRYPGIVSANAYKLYSTTANMKNISNRNGITEQGPSYLCLGCHDGSTLGGTGLRVQPLDGNSYVKGPDGETGIASGRSTRIGPDLSSHHPVNFNVTTGGEENGLGDLITVNGSTVMMTKTAKTGMPLFKTPRGDNTLECASCHATHDPLNPSFLRASMAGNELCLACHLY
jgi:predicted CXXCH cytochrome family protein